MRVQWQRQKLRWQLCATATARPTRALPPSGNKIICLCVVEGLAITNPLAVCNFPGKA